MKQAEFIDINDPSVIPTKHWHTCDDGEQIQCDLCPRYCKLHEGQRGLCFVRGRVKDQIVLTSYGRSSGFAIDPIEKKPLNHFYPGSKVLSFGTAGCNLACKFCQNWDISKSRKMDTMMQTASPEQIAEWALEQHCKSVAYTYNDPVIFHEYAIDTALACRERGIKNVAVTAGYICEKPREEFFSVMDAANIDLKAFTEDFYWQQTGSHLRTVLETLEYLKNETSVWFEITTLLIPGLNDTPKELNEMCDWVVDKLGPNIPIHFSAFHPDYKLRHLPRTSEESLFRARHIAKEAGIHHVYTGNIHSESSSSTYCHSCNQRLIGRDWYQITGINLDFKQNDEARCPACSSRCAGHFAQD
jgi:pyruvate formate lyase activating enzyme